MVDKPGKNAESILQNDRTDLARELFVSRRLRSMRRKARQASEMEEAFDAILSAVLELEIGDSATLHLVDHGEDEEILEMTAHTGFEACAPDKIKTIGRKEDSPWKRALDSRERVIIESMGQNEEPGPGRDTVPAAGYQAMQSTPLIAWDERAIGVLSTYFRQNRTFSEREEQVLDQLRWEATDIIDRLRKEKELRELTETLDERVEERTAALHKSRERYRTLFNSIDEGFCVIRVLFDEDERPVDFRFLEANPAYERQTGLSDVVGKRCRTVVPGIEEGWFEIYGKVAKTGDPIRFERELDALDRHFDLYAFRIGDPAESKVAVLFSDVTEEKQTQADRKRLMKERERLMRELTLAEQAERRRVADLLHDNVQQHLYGIQMKMKVVQSKAEAAGFEELVEEVEEAGRWIEEGFEITRNLTVDLSPPVLRGEGLADALVWLQSQMSELHDLEVEIEIDSPSLPTLTDDMRVLAFQAVQKLLMNVVNHAGVDRATVALRKDAKVLVICVTDDGRGFDPAEVDIYNQANDAFGLASVRERLRFFGGRVDIDATPGEGTQVTLRIPGQ